MTVLFLRAILVIFAQYPLDEIEESAIARFSKCEIRAVVSYRSSVISGGNARG
jgi:hypothetical protein